MVLFQHFQPANRNQNAYVEMKGIEIITPRNPITAKTTDIQKVIAFGGVSLIGVSPK